MEPSPARPAYGPKLIRPVRERKLLAGELVYLCKALTQRGTYCKSASLVGHGYCKKHSPALRRLGR